MSDTVYIGAAPAPISEVVEGRLWMSGYLKSDMPWRALGIDIVVNLEADSDGRLFEEGKGLYVHLPIRDGDEVQQPELVRLLARMVALLLWQTDHKVLVHCTAGINRSALVVARTLIEMGARPHEAVATLREIRHPMALINRAFEVWLLKEGPRASTMETEIREGKT